MCFSNPLEQKVHHPSAFVLKKVDELPCYLLGAHAESGFSIVANRTGTLRLGRPTVLFREFSISRDSYHVSLFMSVAPCGTGPPAVVGPPYKGSAGAPRTKTSLGVSSIAPRVPPPLRKSRNRID